MKYFIFIFFSLLAGCSTDNVRPYDGQVKVLEEDKPAFEKFELPVKAGESEVVLYVVHTYGFTKEIVEKPRKELFFSVDNGKASSLDAGEYMTLSFSSVPKLLTLKAGCNGYQSRQLELGDGIQLGKTYIISASPSCFFNRYDGTMNLSSGSIRALNEINGKYLIFKTKQKKN